MGAIFDYLEAKDVRMYRMASGLVPYGSHPEMDRFHGQVEECGAALAALGARARAADLRLSFHPGQYAVLNSENGLDDLVGLSERTGLRIVWDALHHRCYDPDRIPVAEALEQALATWPAGPGGEDPHSSPRTAIEERKTKKRRRVSGEWSCRRSAPTPT